MRQQYPLGGYDQDYDSRLSRTQAINCYLEPNKDGSFFRVRRVPGLSSKYEVGLGPIRGMFEIQGELFVVSRNELYKIDSSDTVTLLGDVGGSTTLTKFAANGADDNQIMNISDSNGYIYDPTLGPVFQQITDPDFIAGDGLTSLNQIFWVPQSDSNTFGGSDTANGLSWSATRRASAEQNPDYVTQPVALKGAVWWMGAKTCEYWSLDQADTNVPIRPLVGATVQRGVGAHNSIASWQDNIFWLADDFTVWQIAGNGAQKISDLNVEYAIRGDGRIAGYVNPKGAEGFFIDHPVHKLYVLTFPGDEATWVYDVTTQLWHKRQSEDIGRWRGRESTLFNNQVLVGDYRTGTIWELSESAFTEGGDLLKYQLVTPMVVNQDRDNYISEVIILMEVGVGTINNIDALGVPKAAPIMPKMTLEYTKDGGITWQAKSEISLGSVGDRNVQIIARQFGRVRKGLGFGLRLTVTDEVPVEMYELWMDIEGGM